MVDNHWHQIARSGNICFVSEFICCLVYKGKHAYLKFRGYHLRFSVWHHSDAISSVG